MMTTTRQNAAPTTRMLFLSASRYSGARRLAKTQCRSAPCTSVPCSSDWRPAPHSQRLAPRCLRCCQRCSPANEFSLDHFTGVYLFVHHESHVLENSIDVYDVSLQPLHVILSSLQVLHIGPLRRLPFQQRHPDDTPPLSHCREM